MAAMTPDTVHKLNNFGLDIFCRLASRGAENLLICPLSIASAMSILLTGTTEGSVAEKELTAWIGDNGTPLPESPKDASILVRLANSVWVDGTVWDAYVAHVKNKHGAGVFPVPNDAAIVNSWVSKATDGLILQVLDRLPPHVIAMLVSAVFFKANWTTAFNPAYTYDAPFYGHTGRGGGRVVATVKMMTQQQVRLQYGEVLIDRQAHKKAKIVELPYETQSLREYVATIVVPTGIMTIQDIIQVLRGGKAKVWNHWMMAMSAIELDVLAMPRFKLDYDASLVGTLRDMGIRTVFTGDVLGPPLLRMTNHLYCA